MGPRSIDRGIPRWDGWPKGLLLASMGPRSIDRGIYEATVHGTTGHGLQWGRDQLIAELPAAAFRPGRSAGLQWGRDQLIAELGYPPCLPSAQAGFNGAAIN